MKQIALAALLVGSLSSVPAFAFVAPPPSVGDGIAKSINDYALKRGYSLLDPRIVKTTQAIQARALTLAGSGGSWAKVLAKASPIGRALAVGYMVHDFVYHLDNGDILGMKEDGSFVKAVPGNAIGFGTLQSGSSAYAVLGPYQCVAATPEAAAVCYKVRSQAIDSITDVTLTPVQPGTTAYNNGLRYGATVSYRITSGGTVQGTGYQVYAYLAPATCPPASVYFGSACTSLDSRFQNKETSVAAFADLNQVMNALGLPGIKAIVSPDALPSLWRDTAAQPGYDGLPAPAVGTQIPLQLPAAVADPLAPPQMAPYNPTLPELAKSPAVDPLTAPTTPDGEALPTPVNPAASAPLINLGDDPGTPPPVLEEAPQQLFKPIEDLFADWKTWAIPSHSAICPTFSIAPSIAGYVFSINLQSHCDLIEDHRSTILAAALLCWGVTALFIVLEA